MNNRLFLVLIIALGAISAQATDSSFNANGVNIRFVTAGAGEAIVLVHGWMGDATMWGRDTAGNPKPTPPPGFQVIALDCRGHGKSDKPHDPNKYGAELALDVVRLLDHLKIKKAHLVGYSMGAFVVGKMAATHPDRVLSTVYGGQAPLLIGESGSREIDVFAKAVDDGKGLGPYLMEVRPGMTLEQANAMAKILYDGKDVRAWALAGKSFKGLEVRAEDLKKCKAPALFIHGSKEAESTKTRVAVLQKQIPNSQVKVIQGADHMTTLIKPEFGATIVQFLQSAKKSGL